MPIEQDESFLSGLIEPLLSRLRYLAYTTRGDQSLEDLKGEAWLAAYEIQEEQGGACEPDTEAFRNAVLSRLWARFGRSANPTMRFALRLDQDFETDDGDRVINSIAMGLAAAETDELEIALLNAEARRANQQTLDGRFTEAVAYLQVLDHFHGDLAAIAYCLATSVAVVRTLLSKAAAFAERQTSLFDGVERIVDDFRPVRLPLRVGFRRTPKPWVQVCSFKLPRQLRLFSSLPEVFHGR